MRTGVSQSLLFPILACIFLASGGCAIVRTVRQNGEVETSVGLSPIVTAIRANDVEARAVSVSGVGLAVGPESSTLGVFEMKYVRLDPSCRVVVMVGKPMDLERVASFLHRSPDLCVTNP
jgi:hypothetical protein